MLCYVTVLCRRDSVSASNNILYYVSWPPMIGLYERPLRCTAVLTRGSWRQWWRLGWVGAEPNLVLFSFKSEWSDGWTHTRIGGAHWVFIHWHWVFIHRHWVLVHWIRCGGGGVGVTTVRRAGVQARGDGGDAGHDARAVHAAHVETHRWHTENKTFKTLLWKHALLIIITIPWLIVHEWCVETPGKTFW